jgi:hypothetical protein
MRGARIRQPEQMAAKPAKLISYRAERPRSQRRFDSRFNRLPIVKLTRLSTGRNIL